VLSLQHISKKIFVVDTFTYDVRAADSTKFEQNLIGADVLNEVRSSYSSSPDKRLLVQRQHCNSRSVVASYGIFLHSSVNQLGYITVSFLSPTSQYVTNDHTMTSQSLC